MKTFIFNGKVEAQIKEFERFKENLKEINLVKINFYFCPEGKVTIDTVRKDTEKISKILGEDTKVEYTMQSDENLKDSEYKIKIDIK